MATSPFDEDVATPQGDSFSDAPAYSPSGGSGKKQSNHPPIFHRKFIIKSLKIILALKMKKLNL